MQRILRLHEVEVFTGLKRSSIYRLIQLGTFPAQIKITKKASGWAQSSIDNWIEGRIRESQRENEAA